MKKLVLSLLVFPAFAQAGVKGKDCANLEGFWRNESGTQFEINQIGCESIVFMDHKANFRLDFDLSTKKPARMNDEFLKSLDLKGDMHKLAKKLRMTAKFVTPSQYGHELDLTLAGTFPMARGLKKDHWTGDHHMQFTMKGKMRLGIDYSDRSSIVADKIFIDTEGIELQGVEGVPSHEQPKSFIRGANVVLSMFTGMLNARLFKVGAVGQEDR